MTTAGSFVGKANPAALGNGPAVTHGGLLYDTHNASQPWSLRTYQGYDRFELRAGDRWPSDLTSERTELSGQRNPLPFGADVWLSFAQRVTATGLTSPWMVLAQFRATDDAGDYPSRSPVWAQQFSGSTFVITTRSDPSPSSAGNLPQVDRYTDPDFETGVWHHFVYRLRFSQTGLGELQAWIDGTEVIPTLAIPMGYNDTTGPFLKYGIYRSPASETVVAEFANVEIGSSSLLSRVIDPLPISTP